MDDVAVVIDVALLDVVEETVLPFVSFQKRMMLYSVSLVAVASRSAMAWRMEPTVSGELLSLHNLLSLSNIQTSLILHSLNRRFLGLYAERGDQRCELLDVNHNLLLIYVFSKSRSSPSSSKRQEKSKKSIIILND